MNQPAGVAVDSSGNVYIADTANNRIRQVSPAGVISTFVGPGGIVANPPLNQPAGVFVTATGDVYIADTVNCLIRKVTAGSNSVATIAGAGLAGYFGDGAAAASAVLYNPTGIAVDSSGNVFVADSLNHRIREISASTGFISTVAGNGSNGFAGDGAAATAAELYNPTGIAIDAAGNMYIADKSNNRVRKVNPSGTISTIAGTSIAGYSGDGGNATAAALYNPTGIAVDAAGNIFVAVALSNRIRKITPGGIISTVAGAGIQFFSGDGGSATSATFSHPGAVVVDGSGNLFIADTGNNRIREVSYPVYGVPSILSGGIVPINSTSTTIQSGEWVSIYGSNLATSTANWAGDFPTSLGGATVTIGGNQAYLYYASPGQINLQVPADIGSGTVQVVVTTAGGSASSTVTVGQYGPSFLLFDAKHVTGIILRAGGGYDLLGPTGNALGVPTVAAKAGDTVELFANGLGPTNPYVSPGQLFAGNAPTGSPVTLLINNVTVKPSFAGLSPSLLYQINVTIPAGLGTGDVPLVANVGGVQTQTGVVISLQ